jgi:hypothetical protein
MKKILIFIFACFAFVSCEEAGTTSKCLDGTELNLPDELKGLKVYSVSTDNGTIKVAILDSTVNSATYAVGKSRESVIIVNRLEDSREIHGEIISETDSIIVIHKN